VTKTLADEREARYPVQHFLSTISIRFGFLLLVVLASGCTELPDILTGAKAEPTDVAAQRPEATLTISQPPAGAILPSGRVTVAVNYNGPPLVATDTATDLNQYHLDYLLDVNARSYLQTKVPIPLDNQSIIHTSHTQVSFDNVVPGTHMLAVALTGSNDVSPNPPVAQQISFTVK
jgi:hypothetical protein